MEKHQLIALIHIAKNQAKECITCTRIFFDKNCPRCKCISYISLRDERYREILKMLTGKTSCSKLEKEELEKVYQLFYHAGFRPKEKKENSQIKRDIKSGNKGTIKTIYGRGKAILGPTYQSRIEGFVKIKFDKNSLYKCTKKELRVVIGWINRLGKKI